VCPRRWPRVALLVVLAWAVDSTVALVSATAQPGVSEPWTAPGGRDHGLVGTIWDVARGRSIDPSTLLARVADRRFVLLGERHDNADHHRLQAWIVAGLGAAGRRPAVALEMLDADDQTAVDRHFVASPGDVDGLADAVDWKRSGWPDWAIYRPIVQAAVAARMPIVAANLGRADLTALRQGGLGALDAERRARLAVDRPLAPGSREDLTAEIREAHCGHATEAMVARMIDIQRARDARMADAMIAAGGDGALLIAGAGHVRRDLGVPTYLAARGAGPAAAVAFLEVRADAAEPAAYARGRGTGSPPFDYIWFTPRLDDVDACEKFKESLERMRRR
jgi:uncharacterized iron-regulated protein